MLILRGKIIDTKTIVREAVRVLRQGGVVAFPTETTYGLGCDPRNAKAVAEIFKMKGRGKNKPLSLVASSSVEVKRAAILDGAAASFGRCHWPGPLTLVLPVRRGARLQRLVAPKGEVAIRVSSSPFVRELVRAFGFPLVATSANKSGEPECRSGRSVRRVFQDAKTKPDLIADLGVLRKRKPSTVARVWKNGKIEILRRGSVKVTVGG